jgi:hypothetical protein
MESIKIAQLKCNRDIFNVSLKDKYARCSLNGIDIIGSKDLETFAPIVAMLVMSACTAPNTVVSIKKNPSYGEFLKNIVDTVTKSDQVKIKMLTDKPDEIADQKPKQAQITGNDLENYRCSIQTYGDCFNDILVLSDVLLKTKLPKNVLAFKDLSSVLTKVKATTSELLKDKEHCDIIVEQTGNRVGRVMVAMESGNLNDPRIKKSVQESVDHIIADFMGTKKLLASLISSHYPLYNINPLFKKHTDYPATWFFDPSVFYSFTERYKDASDNLIEAVRTEASVIRPMYAWKIKVTEES